LGTGRPGWKQFPSRSARAFATLVSGNLEDFERVPGLRVENWLKSS
jgi:hypothetical protein